MLSPAEVNAIKDSVSGKSAKTTPSIKDSRYELADDDDDDYDDDEGGISAKLEKAMTIGGFIIGAIIICTLIYFIAKGAGFFRSGDEESTAPTQQESISEQQAGSEDMIETPTLLGLTREQAQVSVSGSSIGIKYAGSEPSDEYPEGQICRQDPEPHTMVARNTTVNFYVSSGKDQMAIPKVTGISEEEARQLLESYGFTDIVSTSEMSEEVATGTVMSVSPNEGVMTNPDTQIVLTVSSGPETALDEVTMLNWAGIDEATAKRILESQGFRVKIDYSYTNALGLGAVMDQDPKPGTLARKGQEITLIINDADYKDMPSSEESASEESKPEEDDSQSMNQNTGTVTNDWVTDVRLDVTTDYQGGPWRLTLVQNVNGENTEVVVAEGKELTFPYDFNYKEGASGVTSGEVYLYEMVGDSYVRKAKWTVPFEAG